MLDKYSMARVIEMTKADIRKYKRIRDDLENLIESAINVKETYETEYNELINGGKK